MTHDALHDRLSEVEAYLTHEFERQALDPAAYIDAINALADAQLALARAGSPAAERPMREASAAELRFQRREQRNARARACLRAAVAASLCFADGGDAEAGEWLLQLSRNMPSVPFRAVAKATPSRQPTRVTTSALSSRNANRMHYLRNHRRSA
jgi:hypothetical protein